MKSVMQSNCIIGYEFIRKLTVGSGVKAPPLPLKCKGTIGRTKIKIKDIIK